MKTEIREGFVVGSVAAVTVGIFIVDLYTPRGVTNQMLYIVPLLISFLSAGTTVPLAVACLCTVLTIAGGLLSPNSLQIPAWVTLSNRLFSLVVIWMPLLYYYQRRRHEAELGWLNKELEARVQARTRELVAVNDALVAEVTERMNTEQSLRQSEEALRFSEERLSGVLDIAEDAIVSTDDAQRITLFNQGAVRLFGYQPEEVLGQPLGLLLPLRVHQAHRQHIRQFGHEPDMARRMGERREVFGRRKDGTEFPAEASISKLVMKGQNTFTAILRDVTERRRMEEALRLQGVVVANMAEGVCVVRAADTAIVYVNATFERMFGYEPGELLGQPANVVNAPGERSPEDAAREMIGRLQRAGVWKGEVYTRKKDGTPFWCEATVSGLEHPGYGRVWVAVHSDITKRKLAQQALEISQEALRRNREELRALAAQLLRIQDEERRRISRDLHDDINQRLAILAVEIERLGERLASAPVQVGRSVRAIQDRVVELSEDLRHLAYQLHPPILDDLGLPVSLQRMIDEFVARSGVHGGFVHRNVPEVLSQEIATCLYRIVQESLSNVSRHAKASRVDVELARSGDGLMVTVTDDGIGFNPGPLRDGRGGLGLLSMKERVALVEGVLEVSSTLGKGTQVRALVPLLEEEG